MNSYQFPSNPNFSFIENLPLPYPTYHKDVVMVLDSVKHLFSMYFKNVNARPLTVQCNSPYRNEPETVFELQTIFLCVPPVDDKGAPGCYWSQFIYQFSHEFCHYMVGSHVTKSMRWMEESICEMASHFFLIKSSEQWKTNPPYPNFYDYSEKIIRYQHDMSLDAIPVLISEFFNSECSDLQSLETNEYQREQNRYIALKMLPMFLEKPDLWMIVPWLSYLKNEYSFSQNVLLLENLSGQDCSTIRYLFGMSDK